MQNKGDKNKDVEKMLRKLGKVKVEYPENLRSKRRESWIRQIFLNKYFWLIVLLIGIVIMCILFTDSLPVASGTTIISYP